MYSKNTEYQRSIYHNTKVLFSYTITNTKLLNIQIIKIFDIIYDILCLALISPFNKYNKFKLLKLIMINNINKSKMNWRLNLNLINKNILYYQLKINRKITLNENFGGVKGIK